MPNASKIVINGVTKIDLTGDTAVEADVVSGKTFHKADGSAATGTYSGGSVSIDTKTATASSYPVQIQFSSLKGEPKAFFLRSSTQISSSGNTTYYYIIDIEYDGTNHHGNCFRIGSTRRVETITNGYSHTYSNGTLTIKSSASSRSSSPGAFNNTYELIYIY